MLKLSICSTSIDIGPFHSTIRSEVQLSCAHSFWQFQFSKQWVRSVKVQVNVCAERLCDYIRSTEKLQVLMSSCATGKHMPLQVMYVRRCILNAM